MLLFAPFYLLETALSVNFHKLRLCELQSVCTAVSVGTAENHTEPDKTASLLTDI